MNTKEALKHFWILARPYKWTFLLVSIFVIFISLFKLLEKYLFKLIIDNGTDFTNGVLLQKDFSWLLVLIGITFATSLLLRTLFFWLQLHYINRLEMDIVFDLKRKYFNHILHLSHTFHTSSKTGSLISRLGRGARAIEGIVDFIIFNGAPVLLNLFIVGASVYYFDRGSAFMLLFVYVLFIGYSLFLLKKTKVQREESNDAEDIEKGIVGDFFTNIDSVKYYGKESEVKGIFSRYAQDTKKKMIRALDFYKWLDPGQSFIVGMGLLLIMYFPLVKFLHGEISIGTLAFIYAVYGSAADPLFSFVYGLKKVNESTVDLKSLFAYGNIQNDIKDSPQAQDAKIERGEIELRNISFGYHKKKLIIDTLSLKIHPHEKVAFVGHSGSGKTTLMKLVYRLYDPKKGEILIDGKNIKMFKQESLRSALSIVPQECILFYDTIYNNIAFSNPKASRKEVLKAIRFAQLDEFISSLPQKEHTFVGERGVKLSGGEKQRVSIARALLANQKILLLDEATSALDSKTEHQIQEELKKLMVGRTTLIIAHRLSTIMDADRIIVLSKGKIVQIGTHKSLIKQEGMYKELWAMQKGGYI